MAVALSLLNLKKQFKINDNFIKDEFVKSGGTINWRVKLYTPKVPGWWPLQYRYTIYETIIVLKIL